MMDYKIIYKSESIGGPFNLGIQISIAGPRAESEAVKNAAHEAARILEQSITREFHATDPAALEWAKICRDQLLACFPQSIWVEERPNGYCGRACCEHLPWFKVTTFIGPITVGWRKRVIVIDWSESAVTAEAQELFPDEDVTKAGRLIHAWSYEKAQAYIHRLLGLSPLAPTNKTEGSHV